MVKKTVTRTTTSNLPTQVGKSAPISGSQPFRCYLILDGGSWVDCAVKQFETLDEVLKYGREVLLEIAEEMEGDFALARNSQCWSEHNYVAVEIRENARHFCYLYYYEGKIHRDDNNEHLLTYAEIVDRWGRN